MIISVQVKKIFLAKNYSGLGFINGNKFKQQNLGSDKFKFPDKNLSHYALSLAAGNNSVNVAPKSSFPSANIKPL